MSDPGQVRRAHSAPVRQDEQATRARADWPVRTGPCARHCHAGPSAGLWGGAREGRGEKAARGSARGGTGPPARAPSSGHGTLAAATGATQGSRHVTWAAGRRSSRDEVACPGPGGSPVRSRVPCGHSGASARQGTADRRRSGRPAGPPDAISATLRILHTRPRGGRSARPDKGRLGPMLPPHRTEPRPQQPGSRGFGPRVPAPLVARTRPSPHASQDSKPRVGAVWPGHRIPPGPAGSGCPASPQMALQRRDRPPERFRRAARDGDVSERL